MPNVMHRTSATLAGGLAALLTLSACNTPPGPVDVWDPYEAQNRKIHANNVATDRAVLRPVARAWSESVPGPVRQGAVNFATNLEAPSHVVNDVLQGEGEDAVHNLFRFVINSTLGIGGIFDPASSFGLEPRDTDFGETLFVWGAPEGAYLELPLLGPSTERDAAGTVVDIVLNPVGVIASDLPNWVSPTGRVVRVIDTRARLATSIDGILYESADSYGQSRSIYLQNRRFELGDEAEDTYFDPYEDLYGE